MYKDYIYLYAGRLTHFGGFLSDADHTGAFCLRVSFISTISYETVGGRLIMFGE